MKFTHGWMKQVQVMLLTRISFNQIQICWLYHPRFAEWFCHDLLHRLVFGKPYQPISPKTSSVKLSFLTQKFPRSSEGLWSVHHWGPARGYYGFAYYRQLCHNTGATKGSKVECQSLEANALPKKLRWNLISFDLVKILRLTSSAPFSHFKSENHFCSPHFWNSFSCISAILKFGAPMSTWAIMVSSDDSPSPAGLKHSNKRLEVKGWSALSFDVVVFKDFFYF